MGEEEDRLVIRKPGEVLVAGAGLVTGYITLGIIVLTTGFWMVALRGAAATSGGTPS